MRTIKNQRLTFFIEKDVKVKVKHTQKISTLRKELPSYINSEEIGFKIKKRESPSISISRKVYRTIYTVRNQSICSEGRLLPNEEPDEWKYLSLSSLVSTTYQT